MAFFSYSQLALYVKCPFKFYLERMQKVEVPLDERRHFLGTVLAHALETFYKSQYWRAPVPAVLLEGAIRVAASRVDAASTCPWGPGERERIVALAVSLVPSLLDVIAREQLLGLRTYVEHDVQVRVEGDTIVGRTDLVVDAPGGEPGLLVVDGKAGGTLGRHVRMDQLRFYALGVLEDARFGRLPDRVGFWWFRHGRVVWRTPTAAHLTKFKEGIRQTIARLRARDFTPKPTRDCRLCDVRAHCPEGQAFLRSTHVDDLPLGLATNAGEISL